MPLDPATGFTVVIPAYNPGAMLREALESIARQTLPPTAVVVVDDGSSDGTATDNGDGTFNLDLSITFDDDVDVDSFTLDCTNGADSADDFSIPNASDDGTISPQASGTLTVTLDGLTDTETGSYSCNLTLIDEDNDASATFEFDFDLT